MTNICYVDPVGGVAGDMLLAALLDAGAPTSAVFEAIEAVVPGRFHGVPETVRRQTLRALWLRIDQRAPAQPPRRTVRDLLSIVDRASLPPPVAERARRVLERLGEAESRVHGEGSPHLHELADDDTLLDVVGACAALHALHIERILVGPLPMPAGSEIETGHGRMPLPAPVTLELVRGYDVDLRGEGEMVTPTGAAIVTALGEPAHEPPAMRIVSTGYGAGTRDLPDRPNVVRLIVGETLDTRPHREELVVLETNVDDLTPELVADAVEALLRAGALDAWTTPVTMKKGRPAVTISALTEPDRVRDIESVLFQTTTTFGVRSHRVARSALERRVATVNVAGGSVRVKLGVLDGSVVSATPEHDDVAALARETDRSVRSVYQEAGAAARTLLGDHVQS